MTEGRDPSSPFDGDEQRDDASDQSERWPSAGRREDDETVLDDGAGWEDSGDDEPEEEPEGEPEDGTDARDGALVSAGVAAGASEAAAKGRRRRAAARRPGAKAKRGSRPRQGPVRRVRRRWRETVAELRKVVWPTRSQLVTYTIVVIVFVSVFCAYAAGLDFGLNRLMFWVFG